MTARRLIAICLAVASLATTGCGRSPETVRRELQAQYGRMDEALQKRDLAGLMAPLSSGYRLQMTNGTVLTRDQLQVKMADAFKTGETKSRTELVEVTPTSGGADVVAVTHQSGGYTDTHGRTHVVEINAKSRDTWEYRSSAWSLSASRELSHDDKLDGAPYPPRK